MSFDAGPASCVRPRLQGQPRTPTRKSLFVEPERDLFLLKDESLLATVWRCCRKMRPEVQIQFEAGIVRGSVVGASSHGLSVGFADPEDLEPVEPGDCTATFSLYDVRFIVRARLAPVAGGWWLEQPQLYTLDRRAASRVSVPAGQARLRWPHLADGGLRCDEAAVSDLTPDGVLIAAPTGVTAPTHRPFAAALHLRGRELSCVAEARSQVEVDEQTFTGVYLRVGREEGALVDLYLGERFPQLLPRREVDASEVSQLIQRSGYLALKDGLKLSPAWHRLESPGSKDVVYRARNGQLLGHLSISRIYNNAWMLHQFATLGGDSESGSCRRTLYEFAGTVPVAIDGSKARVLAYFNRSSRWHRRFFEAFPAWVGDERLAVITSLDRFERDADAGSAPEPSAVSGTTVSLLDDRDRVLATALAREQLPALTADLFDIHPDRLRTRKLVSGLDREREVFALHVDGQLKGVALCETGAGHASLFNLLNMAQFYFCLGPSAPTPGQQLLLLAEVRRFYAERGVQRPIVVAPEGTFAAASEPGTRLIEAMGAISISGRGIRQWENFCRFHLGQLYARNSVHESAAARKTARVAEQRVATGRSVRQQRLREPADSEVVGLRPIQLVPRKVEPELVVHDQRTR